jgi:hypothetical protein
VWNREKNWSKIMQFTTTRSAPAVRTLILAAVVLTASGCQSRPAASSGYLTSYAGLPSAERKRKGSAYRRDDMASDAIQTVFIQPAQIAPDIETELSPKEKAMVLHEVDRQICFEVSERFIIAQSPSPQAGTIRTAIIRLQSNSRVGSVAAAAIDFVNPLPMVNFRVPASTGGLAVESELLAPGGRQVAAVLWSKTAGVIGRTKPSLSRAGDALQLAEPLGDKLAKAFATEDRPKIKVGKPDPCERFGSRRNIRRTVASGVVGGVTGLYMPQAAGTSGSQKKADD